MVTNRAGKSSLGCLVTLLLLSAFIYFGVRVGEVYWRAYQFEDAIKQEVRFARQIPDDRMRTHLRAVADSLELPPEAGEIDIRRSSNGIEVEARYAERVEFPFYVRELRFHPRVENTY